MKTIYKSKPEPKPICSHQLDNQSHQNCQKVYYLREVVQFMANLEKTTKMFIRVRGAF